VAGSRGTSRRRSPPRTPAEALRWVDEHGIVVESAKSALPSLAATIAGEPIRGSWWAHPKAQQIFVLAEAIRDSEDIVTCRLVDGKITFVHRRLWPALVRLQHRFEKDRLAKVVSEHTPSGKHVTRLTPFPTWVPRDVVKEGKVMTEQEAEGMLASVIPSESDDRSKHRSSPKKGRR
jgi:hypothetical protein